MNEEEKQELETLGLTNILLTDHCYVYAKLPALVFKGVYRHGVAAMHLLEQRQLEALCRRFQHLLAECYKHRVRKALYRPCHGARVDYLFGCIERICNAHMAPLFALI